MNIDGNVGNKYQGPIITRPYDFGTDAIERQRVSLGQSLIDADFEYGLQATKWQSYFDTRKLPSFFEIPGTDIPITNIGTDASTPSLITITVPSGTSLPTVGTPINISGLENTDRNADRAEGFFIITAASGTTIQYTAKGQVTGSTISTSYTVVRRGGFYNANNAVSGNCCVYYSSVVGSAGTTTVTTPENHGLVAGTPITLTQFAIAGANGNFFIESVPTLRTFSFTNASLVGNAGTLGRIYIQPYSYTIHRPFDGGVLISSAIPSFGSSVVRQSKKVFRYQSGKGLIWSSGTLFCPNSDLVSISSTGTTPGSTITINTGIGHGVPQSGCTIQIRGVTTSGYNGNYIIQSVINSNQVTVTATQTLGSTTGVLGDRARFIISRWHGASVRVGIFDDQNGIYWEWDGQTLWVVKRSSTFQLTGTVTCAVNGTRLTGSGTRFTSQLRVNDKFTIRGMTHCVTAIDTDTSLSFLPPYRGTSTITVGVIACKILEQRTPQTLFNRDTINGNGPSGFTIDITKMQMLGIQYSWYGAGFIDFMIRGQDGNWVYAHRYAQNNINDEAYMRTGNQPVRYELVNETSHATTTLLTGMNSGGDTVINTTDDLTYWPSSGTVLVDAELISYSSKTSNTLIINSRAATLSYNIIDIQRSFTGSPASAHLVSNTVNLVSTTCCPNLTHWGSACLMDGSFDTDRGYFFNYQVNAFNTSVATGSTQNLFLLRLAPSVSNGIVGDIGSRDLLNRAQFLLQRLDVWSANTITTSNTSIIVSGILNPVFQNLTTSTSWVAINSTANGSQPSFTQVYPPASMSGLGSFTTGSGERIFSTICNGNTQYSIDLSGLKEICNSTIGGRNMFPDGPDTLLIQISVPTGAPPITSYALNLFWSEAQA